MNRARNQIRTSPGPHSALCLLYSLFCRPPTNPERALQIAPSRAKQTQFQIPQNRHNLFRTRNLQEYAAPITTKKQTQSNPTSSRRTARRNRIESKSAPTPARFLLPSGPFLLCPSVPLLVSVIQTLSGNCLGFRISCFGFPFFTPSKAAAGPACPSIYSSR